MLSVSVSVAASKRLQTAEAEARLKTAAGDWTAVAAELWTVPQSVTVLRTSQQVPGQGYSQ